MSENFGFVDVDHLPFPSTMRVDYVRVYQDPDNKNWGCDPDDYPTAAYINTLVIFVTVRIYTNSTPRYLEAYSNPNITTWVDGFGQPLPKNKLIDDCSS